MLSYLSLLFLGVVQAQINGLWENRNIYDLEMHYNDYVGPGSRAFAQTWIDSDSVLWLYGGIGYNKTCNSSGLHIYDDMWKKTATGWENVVQNGFVVGPRAAGLTWVFADLLYLYGGEQDFVSYSYTESEFMRPTQIGNMYQFSSLTNTWYLLRTGAVSVNSTEPGARLCAATFSRLGSLYIFGGITSEGYYRNDFWAFDVFNADNGWVPNVVLGSAATNCLAGSVPACLCGASTASVGEIVYLAGGKTVDGASTDVWNLTSTSWTQTTSLNQGVYYANVLQQNASTIFYLFGGKFDDASCSLLQGFDTVNLNKSFGELAISGRYAAQVWGDQIYGGISLSQGISQIFADVLWIQSIAIWGAFTKSPWLQLPAYSAPQVHPGARKDAMTWVEKDTGNLWLYGGLPAYTCTDGNMLTDLWKYNLAVHTWDLVTDTGPVMARGAATWMDDSGNLWLYGGDLSTTDVPNYSCALYVYQVVSPVGWVTGLGCPPVPVRFRPITWTSGGLLYMGGGISPTDGKNLLDLQLFDPLPESRIWNNAGEHLMLNASTLYMVKWIADDYIYIFLQNQSLFRWDKSSDNGWTEVPNYGPYRPSYRQNAISWLDGGGNLWLTKGDADPDDRVLWVFYFQGSYWNLVNITSPPGALIQPAPFWNSAWNYVWAPEIGSSTISMWFLDPCEYASAYCPAGTVCVHNATTRCWAVEDFEPVIQFDFMNTLMDTKGMFYLDTDTSNYVPSGCGIAVNTSLATSNLLPPQVWIGVNDDFSIGARLKFVGAPDPFTIMGDASCGAVWSLNYSAAATKLTLTYSGFTSGVAPVLINLANYFQIFIVRSGVSFWVYIDNSLIISAALEVDYTVTNGITIGSCVSPGTMMIDDVAIYNLPSSDPTVYNPCANNTETEIKQCGGTYTQPGYYYLSATTSFTDYPCITFSNTENVVFDGKGHELSCSSTLKGLCTAIHFVNTTSLVAQNFDALNSGILLEDCANYSLKSITVHSADVGLTILESDGTVTGCTYTENTIGIKAIGGKSITIKSGLLSGSTFGVVTEHIDNVGISSLNFVNISPKPTLYAQAAFISVNSSRTSTMNVLVENCKFSVGACIGPAINISAFASIIDFHSNTMQSIHPSSNTEKFDLVYLHAYTHFTVDFNDNTFNNFMVGCNEFSFLGLASVEFQGTANIYRNNFRDVTARVQNCSAADSLPFKGVWASNMDMTVGTLHITNISLPNLIGESLEGEGGSNMDMTVGTLHITNISLPDLIGESLMKVNKEVRYMAGMALYNQSSLKLQTSQFANFTAPSITPCNCLEMSGYSALAVVSAGGATDATISDSTFESFRAGNAGIIPGFVSGLSQATGGNTGIFAVADGTAYIRIENSTYNYFHNGDGKQPFDQRVLSNCTAGGDFFVVPQGTITSQDITTELVPKGTQNGTSCFSPCNPGCIAGQTCGFNGMCVCYPYYVPYGNNCVVNAIDDCSPEPGAQLLSDGGFETKNIFSNGHLETVWGGCGNSTLMMSSTYSPSTLLSNLSVNIGQAVNISFWTRGLDLEQSVLVQVLFSDGNSARSNKFFALGPGTFGWNKQSFTYKPSIFNITNVNITISVPASGYSIFDNFAITGILTCNMSCGPSQLCELIGGVPTCVCFSGYETYPQNGICVDVNECLDSALNATCNENAHCVNLNGTFNCTCYRGFEGDGYLTCSPVCLCPPHGTCGPLNGTHYNCSCDSGFFENNGECVDLNECATPQKYCNLSISYCHNLIGNYSCDPCPPGSQGTIYGQCPDINECLVHNGGCDPHVVCINTSPWWTCPPCPALFTGNSSIKCNPLCGDDHCDESIGETCVSCPFDCKNATCSQCGDGKCDPTESCNSCFDDCSSQCVLKKCQVPDCSGHGTCLDGTCFCSDNWSGPDCKVNNVPVIVTTPTPDPVVTVTPSQKTSFSISISNIQELRPDSSIVEQFDLQNFTKTTNQTAYSTIWFFTTTLDNQAFVNITIQFFNDTTTGNFANKTNNFAANTIKFNVNVQNWPFKSAQNTLAILMGAANDQQATRSCNIDSNTNSNGSLTWYTLSINGVAMYGQFSQDAILDGRNRIITFRLNPENGQVTAIVPHFWEEMDLDPTFSVLVGKATDNCKKHSNVNKTVYIAVFVTLGVLIILGVAGYFLYPKLRTLFKVRKSGVELQSIPSTDEEHRPVIEKATDMEVYTHAGKYTVRM